MTEKKSKKKKLRFKGLLVILLVFYLLGTCIYYIYKMPIKNIYIEGNYYLKDNYIINYLSLNDKSVLSVSKNKIKNNLLELDLISDVKVRKNYFGKLYIELIEDKILFYNWNNKKIVLSSGEKINYNKDYLGVPTLINYVPDNIYDDFVDKLNTIDKEILSMVSEIEYSPSVVNDKVVDDKRFLFRMNDGNIVYVNTINIEKFNNYLEMYEYLANKTGEVKGCLYLDSNSENITFNKCDGNKVIEEDDKNNGES